MIGSHSGVLTRIKVVAKYVLYVHCHRHCMNQILVDVVKSVPEAADFYCFLRREYVFISGSFVHQNWLKIQIEMFKGMPRGLQRLCDTRQACRCFACETIVDRLGAIIRVLHEISNKETLKEQ